MTKDVEKLHALKSTLDERVRLRNEDAQRRAEDIIEKQRAEGRRAAHGDLSKWVRTFERAMRDFPSPHKLNLRFVPGFFGGYKCSNELKSWPSSNGYPYCPRINIGRLFERNFLESYCAELNTLIGAPFHIQTYEADHSDFVWIDISW